MENQNLTKGKLIDNPQLMQAKLECIDQLNLVHKADLMASIAHAVSSNKLDEVDKANLLHLNNFLKELIRVES